MFPSSTLILLLELKINNPHPALIWFSLNLGISHSKHSKSSVKCLIIKFSIWPQLSTHFQAYFILLNTCLMETSDFLLKYDLVHSSPTAQPSHGDFLFTMISGFFSLSTVLSLLSWITALLCWFIFLL